MSDYGIQESRGYFGRLEGVVNSVLFGCKVPFLTDRDGEEVFARRCAEYFERLTLENETFRRALDCAAEYLTDFLEENGDNFELDWANYTDITAESIVKLCAPIQLIFEKHDLLTDEDSPIAFSLKLRLKDLADEFIEIAIREDMPIYAGEYRGVSPWNEKLLKKKWNYVS